ncbi:RxLR effector protein [Phytophthora megakarya]|uniref:RxLR effector protein n=1 Tax=Phytophthora megakarya TaxID=4795 RepID=A0A225V3H7_9STRA|nr:RxLR effector protein [Phytophthora megakarya]
MRLQDWIPLAMLIALFTPLSTVLSLEANSNGPSEVKAATNFVGISERLLRGNRDITTGIEKLNTMEGSDDERAIAVPQGLQNAVINSAKWPQKQLFSAIEMVAGRRAADKAAMMMVDKVWFPILYMRKMTPGKYRRLRARNRFG